MRRLHAKPTQRDNEVTAVTQALMMHGPEKMREKLTERLESPNAHLKEIAKRHLAILDEITRENPDV